MITLYDFPPSPHCVRVRLALALGGIRHRTVPMRLDGDQKAPAFRALSPFGTVPLLVDGAAAIAQSYAALHWLGEENDALLPRAKGRRARVLAWVAAAATELDPAVRRAYDEAYFTRKPSAERVTAAVRGVRDAMDRLERARVAEGETRFAAGATPTIADAALFPAFWLLADLADDHARVLATKRWPSWGAWYARMKKRDDVARVIAEAEAD